MRPLLLAAIPSGYTVRDFPVSYNVGFDRTAVLPNETYPAPANGGLSVAFSGLLIEDSRGEGMLTASIMASGSQTIGGQCDRGTCEVLVVDGIQIHIHSWRDENGEHIGATRPLDGGSLMVIGSQGIRSDEHSGTSSAKPMLATFPFTKQQLAALAANPAMLQFP